MELIIGGRAQGKLEYTLKVANRSNDEVANAVLDDRKPVVYHLEEVIRNLMKEQKEIMSALELYLEKQPEGYLICEEVGCGIVPLIKEERLFRDTVGRTLCELVKKSTRVHRVFCGIGVVIKDE